jgi:hypothetical protein
MAAQTQSTPAPAEDAAAYLDMPPDRRTAAKAHVATLSAAAGKVADELPLGADVDDFRRVLIAQAQTAQAKP